MPVAAIPVTTTPDPIAGSGSGAATMTPEPGFADALSAVQHYPTYQVSATSGSARLQTVSLGQMVSALAGEPVPVDGGSPAPAATGPADDWGAAAMRPDGIGGAGAAVLDAGERYLGVPYLWGGTDAAKGFDCSGFVQQVYADLGISLPRVSADQAKVGVEVGGLENAQPGDLVFWRGNGSRPNHIGIYAGDGRMLVAPRTGDVVRYQEIQRTPDAVRRITA